MTSKCVRGERVTDVFTTFWRLLRSITEQTHDNMESICFIRNPHKFLALYNELKRKNADKHTCLEPLEFSMICTSLDIFKSQTLVFFSAFSVFLYLTCKQFLWNVFQRLHLLKAELWRKHLAKQRVSRSRQWHKVATVVKFSCGLGIHKLSRTLLDSVCPFFFFVSSSC